MQGYTFSGAKRGSAEEGADSGFESRCFVTSEDVDVCADPSYALVAGTTWALTRPAVDLHAAEHPLDVLIVDEAGQLALADVLAAATSARSLVLLGDPNQLPQVTQGSHPEGAERSVLQHLLGQIQHVGQAQFFAVVDEHRARQGEHCHRHGPSPAQPDVAAAVAGHLSFHVVVRQGPGRDGAIDRGGRE